VRPENQKVCFCLYCFEPIGTNQYLSTYIQVYDFVAAARVLLDSMKTTMLSPSLVSTVWFMELMFLIPNSTWFLLEQTCRFIALVQKEESPYFFTWFD
jgi:hypothetical protein